jgi:hypothetical protein
MTAPVQVVVIGLHKPTFSGEVLDELGRLQQAGIVRLIDLLLVTHAADGTLTTVELPAAPPGLGELASAFLAFPGDEATADPEPSDGTGAREVGQPDSWSLADVVPPGTTAAVAFLEHLWAAPLRAALERGGGIPLEESWLASADLAVLDRLRRDVPTIA